MEKRAEYPNEATNVKLIPRSRSVRSRQVQRPSRSSAKRFEKREKRNMLELCSNHREAETAREYASTVLRE